MTTRTITTIRTTMDSVMVATITLVILKITWDSWKTIRATEPGEPLRDH